MKLEKVGRPLSAPSCSVSHLTRVASHVRLPNALPSNSQESQQNEFIHRQRVERLTRKANNRLALLLEPGVLLMS